MESQQILKAPAKVNLTLDVLNRREDGYHNMRMVMQSVGLYDDLTLTFGGDGIRVKTQAAFLPGDEKNLAVKAALLFWKQLGREPEPMCIELQKHIPVCAGTAGGSSDAAAVLNALNQRCGNPLDQETMRMLGAQVGADVPFCLMGGTALAEGKGEVLTPLPALPNCQIVLSKPNFSISTPELFGRIQCGKIRRRPDTSGVIESLKRGDLTGVARRMYNVFEDVLPERCQTAVKEIKHTLIVHGALGAVMTGTGPTVFGLFDDPVSAQAAYQSLKERYAETFLTGCV